MPRSLGRALPAVLQPLFDGQNLHSKVGETFLLLTTDTDGWPHMAMLSVGELLARDEHTLEAALWLHSTATRNLERTGRGVLAIVADGAGFYVRLLARREEDLDLGVEGRLARFVYMALYQQHLISVHGLLKGLALILIGHVNHVLRPRLKLH